MENWIIDGYKAELTLNEQNLETGIIDLDGAAAHYFDLNYDDKKDRRLLIYYEGREYPSYGQNQREPKLALSKALTSRLIGVFPDYQQYYSSEQEGEDRPKLIFDKTGSDEYNLRLVLPWNKAISLKQDLFEFFGTGKNLGQLKDSYDVVFVRELFDNLDNQGNSDVFMVSGKLKRRLEKRLDATGKVDEQAENNIENLKEAGLDEILSFLLDHQYPKLSEKDFIRINQTNDHFLFQLNPALQTELSTDDRNFIIKNMDQKLEAYYAREDAPSLTDSFEDLMFDYDTYYNKDFRYSFKDLITDSIPDALMNLGVVDLTKYDIRGFAGVDDWALVPYISVTDKESSRIRDTGLYIAYLLNKDTKHLYLTLINGFLPLEDELKHQGLEGEELLEALNLALLQKADAYRGLMSMGTFSKDADKVELPDKRYENGIIAYKLYDKRAPLEETIRADLSELMGLYETALELNPDDYVPEAVVVEEEAQVQEEVPEETEEALEAGEVPEVEETIEKAPVENEEIALEAEEETVEEEPKEAVEDEAVEEPQPAVEVEPIILEGPVEPEVVEPPKPKVRRRPPRPKVHVEVPPITVSQEILDSAKEVVSHDHDRYYFKERQLKEDLSEISDEPIEEILKYLENYIENGGFTLPEKNELVKDLYLSLKTYPLVALTGPRGNSVDLFTRLFSGALGADFENGRFLQVRMMNLDEPNQKMFGSYNAYTNQFTEGVLTDFILQAIRNPEVPYFLYLKDLRLDADADFLGDLISLLDTRRRVDGEVVTDPVLGIERFGSDKVAYERYGRLYLPDNLFIMADIDGDDYSENELKLLDHLSVIPVETEALSLKTSGPVEPKKFGSSPLRGEILSLVEAGDEVDKIKEIITLLEAINSVLSRIGAQIGPKERDQICIYLLYNAQEGLLSQDDALDMAILQKILPRIFGGGKEVEDVIIDLFKVCAGVRDEEAAFNYPGEGGLFPKSARKLSEMAKQLLSDGKTQVLK